MKRLLTLFVLLSPVIVITAWSSWNDYDSLPPKPEDGFMFFNAADISELPSLGMLQTALAGYWLLTADQSIKRPEVITIIDYSLPSDKERLWVIDLINRKVLFRCLVSHGRNSGELEAESFSNIPGSNASSPGFYSTGETYLGKHGLSLVLDGLETGINDNARVRNIVIHGAEYVSSDFIRTHGRLGRSLGCPAVPVDLSKDIINTIKGGSCLFIYVPNPSYTSNSHIINKISAITKVSLSQPQVFGLKLPALYYLSGKHLFGTVSYPSRQSRL
jgi:hypothetical protein